MFLWLICWEREHFYQSCNFYSKGGKNILQISLRIQRRKPVIRLRTTDAGVDGTPNSLTGAGLETTFPAGDLMKAVLGFFFPVSQTETGVRFSVGAFVQPSWRCAARRESSGIARFSTRALYHQCEWELGLRWSGSEGPSADERPISALSHMAL